MRAHFHAGARLAAEVMEAEIACREISVYQLAALEERFDIVLFMGVLYHLRYPLLALDILHEYVTRDLLVFQSMMRGSREAKAFGADYDFTRHFYMGLVREDGTPKLALARLDDAVRLTPRKRRRSPTPHQPSPQRHGIC